MEKTMTVKELSDVFNCDVSTIQKIVKELFPELVKNGKPTLLNEIQATIIKLKLDKHHNLRSTSERPKSDFEKELLIQQAMIFQQEKINKLQEENLLKEKRINLLIHDKKTYTCTEIAKELNLKSANELNKKLEEIGIQYKVNNSWVLTAEYSGEDFISLKQEELDNGKIIYNRHWTGKGRDFLLTLFKVNNNLITQ